MWTTYEWCPFCENEVEIPVEKISPCPECGHSLLPCSYCEHHCSWSAETKSCDMFQRDEATKRNDEIIELRLKNPLQQSILRKKRGGTMRLCKVKGSTAMFHKWSERTEIVPPSPMVGGHSGGVLKYTIAIVECENGQVLEVMPNNVTFQDTLEIMNRKKEVAQ